MLNWNEIIQNHIVKHSNEIKNATKPLHDHFGISYFTYHRIDKNGKYTVLLDRPDWAELYVGAEIYRLDPYLGHPDNYLPGICFVENHGSEEYVETIFREAKKLQMDFSVMIIEKGDDYVEFFGFAGQSEESSLDKLYLNQPSLLKSFAGYFKQKLGPQLLTMEKESNFLLTDIPNKAFRSQALIHPDISLDSHKAFLRDVGMERYLQYAEALSPREKQCLKLLVAGRSAKETGIVLGLSPRTVESYFETIKQKLSCWSKAQVYSIAEKLTELGLLP